MWSVVTINVGSVFNEGILNFIILWLLVWLCGSCHIDDFREMEWVKYVVYIFNSEGRDFLMGG